MQISREQSGELNLELSGGIAADSSGSIYVTTPTAVSVDRQATPYCDCGSNDLTGGHAERFYVKNADRRWVT